jgi:hypothetical protein
VALNSKIPDGMSVDDRCINEIMSLLDQAEHLNKKDPNAKKSVHLILAKFDETVQKIRSSESREKYGSLRSNLETLLKDICSRPTFPSSNPICNPNLCP